MASSKAVAQRYTRRFGPNVARLTQIAMVRGMGQGHKRASRARQVLGALKKSRVVSDRVIRRWGPEGATRRMRKVNKDRTGDWATTNNRLTDIYLSNSAYDMGLRKAVSTPALQMQQSLYNLANPKRTRQKVPRYQEDYEGIERREWHRMHRARAIERQVRKKTKAGPLHPNRKSNWKKNRPPTPWSKK